MPFGSSPELEATLGLSLLVFAIAAVIFVGVEGALLFVMVRFRDRGDGREAARFVGNTRLEIAWTAAPLGILAVIFVLMLATMPPLSAAPSDALVVRVIGHQWWWEYRYGDVVVANELHLPVGRTVVFELTSADVVHSFWVPDLSGKRDMLPTRVGHLTMTPLREGVYAGACAEFCGQQHAWMRIRLVVEPADRFAAWLEGQRANASASTADAGAQLFLSSTCVSCHTVRGTPAAGVAGPDLTHVGSRETLGAGVAANDDAHLAAWIRNAQALKPGALMPPFASMSEAQIGDLVRYLRSLR